MLIKVSVSDHDRQKNRKYLRRWTGTLQKDTRENKGNWELGRERWESHGVVGWGRLESGNKWLMELRIERASLPPVQQLCSPHFGSVAPDACAEGWLDPA